MVLESGKRPGPRHQHKNASLLTQKSIVLLFFIAGMVFFAFTSLSWKISDPDGLPRSTHRLDTAANDRRPVTVASGKVEPKQRIMLASHGRLMWYYPESDTTSVLHEGQGVHYGTFPGSVSASGELQTIWVMVRPHNWHPIATEEVLLELDAETGKELSRIPVPSRFTHDVVRSGDTVYLCNTDKGHVLQLSYPSMQVVRSMELFTRKQHVNTLAPLKPGEIWAVLNNLGKSLIVRIDVPQGDIADQPYVATRIKDIGLKSHGLVQWKGGFIVLDSERGALVWVDDATVAAAEAQASSTPPPTEDQAVVANVTVLWTSPEPGKFLKGLAVIDGIAYFGVSVFSPRSSRQDSDKDSELAAFDIEAGLLLWKRTVPTHGLLNVVSAPQLGEDSTYRPKSTTGVSADLTSGIATSVAAATRRQAISDTSETMGRKGKLESTTSTSSTAELHGEIKAAEKLQEQQAVAGGSTNSNAKIQPAGEVQQQTMGIVSNGEEEDADNGSGVLVSQPEDKEQTSGTISQAVAAVAAPPVVVDASLAEQRQGMLSNQAVKDAAAKLEALGFPPKTSGQWSSGLPFLDLSVKSTKEPWLAGIMLPLIMVNISDLQALVKAAPLGMWEPEEAAKSNVVIGGRKSNTDKFKPGVKAIIMQFSDQSIDHTYRFPYYDHFKSAIEPLVNQVIGPGNLDKVVRMQLTSMPVGSVIKMHRDMGGYALKAHRIHIPVFTYQEVSFEVCAKLDKRGMGRDSDVSEPDDCVSLPMAEGMVFELNNRVLHRVFNTGPQTRIQLVVDVAEEPRVPKQLRAGQACNYVKATIVCEE